MTTFEERAREAIRKMTEDALAAVQQGGVYQQDHIEGYAKQLLASLSLDLPLSVKEVLDKGGAVRSFTLPYELRPGDAMRPFQVLRFAPRFDTASGTIMEERTFGLSEMLPAPRFRVTVIIEPLHEEKRR